ncbi:MAG: hypothetical protein J6S83_08950 [Lachnospiraceae bacterium]|nr:hypothetical protein [Lachnospiraceae bacterium]
MMVYLAGKIGHHGWREKIVQRVDELPDEIYIKKPSATYIDGLYTTGPFFICCDHGCYHGAESHGVGAYSDADFDTNHGFYPDLCSGTGVPSELVPIICKNQITSSDFVFAYIDSDSCFGTLCEIGFAVGKGIPVVTMFASKELRKSMWFVAEIADVVVDNEGYARKARIGNALIYDFAMNISRKILGR